MLEINDIKITWLGHDSYKIEFGEAIIYIDPWKLKKAEKASIVLVTHDHYDHCSADDVGKVAGEDTIIITTPDCAEKLENHVRTIRPGDLVDVKNIRIEATPAYNTDKAFHPKEKKWLGFILTLGDTRIYHAGDTDLIPEMDQIKDITVALLPVSGTYVMTAEEAAEAAKKINAEITIPMHYGDIIGGEDDAERFKALCEGMDVKILKPEN